MSDALLVLNAGSSSLKFSVFLDEEAPQPLLRGQLEGLLTQPRFVARNDTAVVGEKEWPSGTKLGQEDAIDFLFTWGRGGALGVHQIVAAGHRVVHGGMKFTAPVLVDASILAELEALVPLAPLHQPHNVAAIKAVAKMAPVLPQVTCFDTAFHRTQSKVAEAFALPRRFIEEGVRRYGFHGLSYEYIASVLPALDRRAAEGRAVVAHLGNGASMCAMSNGRSIATTMSFTALDGLMMGTRCGAIDPGVLLYLIEHHGMNVRTLTRLLYEQSGLLGVSASPATCARCSRAPTHVRSRRWICSSIASTASWVPWQQPWAVSMRSCSPEASVRTPLRSAPVCRGASWLGLDLDEVANTNGGPHISREGSRVSAWVIPTNEELMIARHMRRLVSRGG
jgi:acetate kinase